MLYTVMVPKVQTTWIEIEAESKDHAIELIENGAGKEIQAAPPYMLEPNKWTFLD